MVSSFNFKSYLSDASRIFKTEAMEAVLWLIKRVYLFLNHLVLRALHSNWKNGDLETELMSNVYFI